IKEGLVFCLHAIGNEYQSYKKFDLAVAAFEEAIAYQPQNADLLYNCGNAFYAMNDYKKALPLYQKAISLQKSADTHNNLGNTYRQLGQFNKAKEHYILAIDANPDKMIHTKVELAHLKQSLCDWDGLDELQEAIKNALDFEDTRISPFTALSMTNMNPQDLLQVSTNWCENYHLPSFERKKTTNQKITIGYLSSDFRLHPLYFLIYDVLKYHDLKTFDIKLFYSGQRENTNEQKSYQGLGYPFIEIKNLSDIELAKKINDEGVDILVDLSGFTQSSRSMISALKPAQIHINWLGFAGSLGSRKQNSLCQYLLADQFIIPKDHQKYYSEEVIYLPHCYQPNIADRGQLKKVLKKDYGFQDDHIILASFGQTIKITPERYASWLTILKQFDNAYLWLLDCNEEAKENLWQVAENHQVDSNRIKFAPKV
ncbi:MAG: tetratricopeptide repeat protein, partial [Methylophilaceae bacterium]